jgi:hypothetical protein
MRNYRAINDDVNLSQITSLMVGTPVGLNKNGEDGCCRLQQITRASLVSCVRMARLKYNVRTVICVAQNQ